MDFTKLLKHCEAEHGIKLDTSDFTDALLYATYRYFDNRHGKTLLHTEQWDILETLQEQPKPGNPPEIVSLMKQRAFENIKSGEPTETSSWYSQEGVLLSNGEALKIAEFCERVNVVDQLPDYGTGFRPPWDLIGPDYDFCAIDKSGSIFFYEINPSINDEYDYWECHSSCEFPYHVKYPVENWRECLWVRPEKQQQ